MRALYVLLALGACDAYDEDLGSSPYLCGSGEPRCPSGYTCTENPTTGAEVCLRAGDTIGAVECADDSAYEPNETLTEAHETAVEADTTVTQEGLAICPAGDRDVFSLVISGDDRHVELLMTYEANGAVLGARLLNAGGIPIATAMEVDGQPRTVRAVAQNVPAGTYFVDVSSATSVNNYSFTLDVTGP